MTRPRRSALHRQFEESDKLERQIRRT
jgi:hypothetical protein